MSDTNTLEKDPLIDARVSLGLTQEELGRRLGKAKNTIYRYEQRPPVLYGWALVGYLFAQGRTSEAHQIISEIEQKSLAI